MSTCAVAYPHYVPFKRIPLSDVAVKAGSFEKLA